LSLPSAPMFASAFVRPILLPATCALLLAGCAGYRAQPLDPAPPATHLTGDHLEAVRMAADKIDHPLLHPMVIDGRGGYTPDELAVMVVVASPQLRALRDQRGVAQAQLIQARLLPNPQFSLGFDRLTGNSDPTLVNGRSLGLAWDISTLLAHGDQTTAASAAAKAVDLDIAWEEWQTAEEARLRTFRLLSLEQRLPLARRATQDAAVRYEHFRRAATHRLVTLADVNAAGDAWNQAKGNVEALEQQIAADRLWLNLALGQAPDARLPLKPVRPHLVFRPNPASVAELSAGLENRRLDLLALRQGYESQEASLRATIKSAFPKIGLNLGKASDTSDVHTWNLGVTIDIPLFDRGQGVIAGAQATRQQLFDEFTARLAEARSQIVQLESDLDQTRRELRRAEALLPDLRASAAGQEQAAASNNADDASLNDARTQLVAAELNASLLRQSVVEINVALEIATGRPLLDQTVTP
ncbi:MAG: TolC family protein, partial [Opitutales bacterium]